jgi:hypothetical protein
MGSVAAAVEIKTSNALLFGYKEQDKAKDIAVATREAAKRVIDMLVSMSTDDSTGGVKEDYSFLTTFAAECTGDPEVMNLEGAGEIIAAIQGHVSAKSPDGNA